MFSKSTFQKLGIASIFYGLGLFTIGSSVSFSEVPAANDKEVTDQPAASNPAVSIRKSETDAKIQIAILLDTSGSMNGLINQTRTEIWSVVNALLEAEKDGKRPMLEVALYEYGQDTISSAENHLRMISQFTGDLDQISEALFRLQTSGGSEYTGAAIQSAATELTWSDSADDLKLLFIAGNEPFSQGRIPFPQAIQDAVEKGIVVNTIHCGEHSLGIRQQWKKGADLGKGDYFSIDHNRQAVYVAAPQDSEINTLNKQLNSTYIPYGAAGKKGKARQVAEDVNASQGGRSAINRSISKSSQYYSNSGWDLVDALFQGGKRFESVKQLELPHEMQNMTKAEQLAYIDTMRKKRKSIQKKIQRLRVERSQYLANHVQENPSENRLDLAIIKALKDQAERKGYRL